MVNRRFYAEMTGVTIGRHTVDDTYQARSRVLCARCGITRYVRPERNYGPLCRDCKWVDPQFGQTPKENTHAV